MKNKIKGCTHHESKVISKFAKGGMAGSANTKAARDSVAGPSKDASGRNASSATGKGGFTGGGGGGGYARNNQAARNEVAAPRKDASGRNVSSMTGNRAAAAARASGSGNPGGVKVVPTSGPAPQSRGFVQKPDAEYVRPGGYGVTATANYLTRNKNYKPTGVSGYYQQPGKDTTYPGGYGQMALEAGITRKVPKGK